MWVEARESSAEVASIRRLAWGLFQTATVRPSSQSLRSSEKCLRFLFPSKPQLRWESSPCPSTATLEPALSFCVWQRGFVILWLLPVEWGHWKRVSGMLAQSKGLHHQVTVGDLRDVHQKHHRASAPTGWTLCTSSCSFLLVSSTWSDRLPQLTAFFTEEETSVSWAASRWSFGSVGPLRLGEWIVGPSWFLHCISRLGGNLPGPMGTMDGR